MINKEPPTIYKLIHSMQQGEKLWFRKQNTLHGKKLGKHMLLFDKIAKMKKYDAKKWSTLIKTFKSKKVFIDTKYYLYEHILDSLKPKQKGDLEKVNEYINKAQILIERNLYMEAKRKLSKAKSLAQRFELYYKLSEIYQIESDLGYQLKLGMHSQRMNRKSDIEDAVKNQKKQLEIDELISLYLRMYSHFSKEIVTRESEDVDLIDELQEQIERKLLESSKGFYHYLYYYIATHYYYLLKNDYDKALNITRREEALWKEHARFIANNLNFYIGFHIRLLNTQIHFQDISHWKEYIDRVRAIEPTTISQEESQFIFLSHFEFQYIGKHGTKEELERIIKYIKNGLNKYTSIPNQILIIYYFSFMDYYSSINNTNEAFFWTTQILNRFNLPYRIEIQRSAFIRHVIFQYELGNLTVVPSSILAVRRKLNNWSGDFQPELAFLKFMNKLIKLNRKSEKKQLCLMFLETCKEYKKNRKHRAAFQSYDFSEWVKSEIARSS